jgi:tRNA modification GTPase
MALALDTNDTIVAVASPPGPALRGIVRLSGRDALALALEGFQPEGDLGLPIRHAVSRAGSLRLDGLRPVLPATLVLWPAPRSYTRQNVAEIHVVGSTPLVSVVMANCLSRGARQAEPGEFTLRAFLSGRIDLTRAEAVLGVIDAQNSTQLEQALQQLAGGLSRPLAALCDRLLDLVAHLEANLDFSEEPDVDPLGRSAMAEALDNAVAELEALLQRLTNRDRTSGYSRAVLVGPPNAGKSMLFNSLLGRDRAIVAARAGTTRDYLSELCACDGLTVELVDTAGIETPSDTVSQEAQASRSLQVKGADLLLECRSAETAGLASELTTAHQRRLLVWTKADRALPDPGDESTTAAIVTSAVTGAGLRALRLAIARTIRGQAADGDLASGTGARCHGSIRRAADALRSAWETITQRGGDELVALDLRLAVDELGKVTGAVVTDDLLDRIFRRFCIGK